jgi:SAM-dependent methyltransferase
MSSTTPVSGSAQRWGPLWGARARDWAETEAQQVPTYEEALRRIGLPPGQSVLEVGCGSGVFLELAERRGALVTGIDASEALVELARDRVHGADVRVGDMEHLPYADASFDAVCGFNSFFFADDMTAALREAARVARPGAPVVVQVWGRPERCGIEAAKAAIGRLLPGPGRGAPPPLWKPGVLEHLAADAGLTPESSFDHTWAYEYADEPALLRSLLSAAPAIIAARTSGEQAVRDAIRVSMAPYLTAGGGYRIEDEWHYLLARAGPVASQL